MKIEKIQLRGNNSACAGIYQLLRGRSPAHLRDNIALHSVTEESNLGTSQITCLIGRFVWVRTKKNRSKLFAGADRNIYG
jgi:hypothetical protein